MKKGILALSLLFLLTLASQCSWCAAEGSARLSAGHRLRPHLQIQEELHGQFFLSLLNRCLDLKKKKNGVSAHAMIVLIILWRVASDSLLGLFMN